MSRPTQTAIAKEIAAFYLTSGDFNGLPATALSERTEQPWPILMPSVARLMARGLVGLISSSVEMNPHIIRTGFPIYEEQSRQLHSAGLDHLCLYPTAKYLATVVQEGKYVSKPFELLLALGSPQLEIRYFDLMILEQYRNDPRYRYDCDDVGGQITVRDDYYQSDSMSDKDKILLQSFGLAFDDSLNRAVGAFVCDLARLTPEHQQIWKAREVQGNWRIHPDFYRSQVLGGWGEHIPIFNAFLLEQHVINKMAVAMGRPPMFREDFGEYCEGKPKGFAYLLRPTAGEFLSFVHLLDKLMSDGIEKAFFGTDIPLEKEHVRKDGRIEVAQLGTIGLLDIWMRKTFRATDWKPLEFAISVFKRVRKIRQGPAHSIDDDAFDQKYVKEQRELMKEAYTSVRIIRDALSTHVAVRQANVKVPDYLDESKILTI